MAERRADELYFFGGADSDSKQTMFAALKGRYRDAHNMRLSDVDKRGLLGLSSIEGEVEEYDMGSDNELVAWATANSIPIATLAEKYVCIGATDCKGHEIMCWASPIIMGVMPPPFIQVDDNIVCMSSGLTFTYNNLLQIDTNESCIGGEIFVTDNSELPLIFNVEDMINNHTLSTDKYFGGFNIALYQVNLFKPVDIPVFVDLVATSDGINVGSYSYAIRYVSESGDRTQFSESTPMISVPLQYSNQPITAPYPFTTSIGGPAGTQSPFKIKLLFRVTNLLNYSYIEVRRVKWVSGAGLGMVPVPEVLQLTQALQPGEISVWEFYDDRNNLWTSLSESENTVSLVSLKTCKTLRYYDNRLVLMNVQLASRDISDTTYLESADGHKVYPYMHKTNSDISQTDATVGFSDPWTHAYNRSYMGGERYSFSLQGYDAVGGRSFADEIISNYLFPNRRDPISSETYRVSVTGWRGVVNASDVNFVDSVNTHDVAIQNNNSNKQKTDLGTTSIEGNNYYPLRPTSYTDSYGEHRQIINDAVVNQFTGAGFSYAYSPSEWCNEIWARGLAVHGVENLPSWVKSFSILRSKPAGRVICQGIVFWSLHEDGQHSKKYKDKIVFWSPDSANAGIEITTSHKIQFVQPLGFFSEVYSGEGYNLNTDFRGIDMAVYARISHNHGYGGAPVMNYLNDGSYETRFGSWRNDRSDSATIFNDPVLKGNTTFSISSATEKYWDNNGASPSATGVRPYWEIDLGADLYLNDDPTNKPDTEDATFREFCEPIYIANIIAEDSEVADNNQNTYYSTGHYQKIDSIIGVTTGSQQQLPLIDERYDDCMPCVYDTLNRANTNTFIYIKDKSTGEERPWLNVQYKSGGDIVTILNSLVGTGTYTADLGNGTTKDVYGVYWSTWSGTNRTGVTTANQFTIVFEQPAAYASYSPSFFFPTSDSYVVVKYDNRFPLKVFGGDTIIGDSSFTYVDGLSSPTGGIYQNSQLKLNIGMPFCIYKIQDNIVITKNMHGGGTIQSEHYIKMDTIRQMVILFTSENRYSSPLLFNYKSDPGDCGSGTYSDDQSWPYIHYTQRPQDWNESNCSDNFANDGSHVAEQYKTDFGGEWIAWNRGGFKTTFMANNDYSQWRSDWPQLTMPKVGFTEETVFCTRAIWSERREINVQDSPGLKTFLAINAYDLMDSTGEIKYAYDAESQKGDNLYAFTENGVCLLLTKKSMISDVGGQDIGYVNAANTLIQGEYWLDKERGMKDEMWRTAKEYQKALFYTNYDGVYMFADNAIKPINANYLNRLYNDGISNIESGYTTIVSAAIDNYHKEYWLSIEKTARTINSNARFICKVASDPFFPEYKQVYVGDYIRITRTGSSVTSTHIYLPDFFVSGNSISFYNDTLLSWVVYEETGTTIIDTIQPLEKKTYTLTGTTWSYADYAGSGYTFVHDIERGVWVGTFGYRFDNFVTDGNTVYGIRDLKTYQLGIGYEINGAEINHEVTTITAKDSSYGKEYKDIRILSSSKPTYVGFSELEDNMPECYLANPMNGNTNAYYLKDYNGYRNRIPRRFETDYSRLQGLSAAIKITHTVASEDFQLDKVQVFYTILRAQ